MSENLAGFARKIIADNIYLTLGTTDGKTPWTAPLFYAVDDRLRFYFISQPDSLHIRNLMKNPSVSFAIFDSHQKEGTGNGVQGSGTVSPLGDDELDEAMTWYRTSFVEMKKESFTGSAPYRFYRLVPDHFYVLDPDAPTDMRAEVFLAK